MRKSRYNYRAYDQELLSELRTNTEGIARKFTSPFTSPEDLQILAEALDHTAEAIRTISSTN